MSLGKDPEDEEVVLGIDETGWHVAEAVVIARYQMFTQVYFHKTRRAYDYHLKEAIKSTLEGGVYPPPNKLDAYLRHDDVSTWTAMVANATDVNCKAVLERQHVRLLYSTPETPLESDMSKLEIVLKKLEDNDIWHHIDRAEKEWYRLNEVGGPEINIINEKGSATPLSNYSHIVRNMKSIKKVSVYVREDDRKQAKRLTGL